MLIISLIVFLPLLTVSTITSYRLRRIHGRKAGNQLSVKVRLVQLNHQWGSFFIGFYYAE
ncbi:hypothetical protein ACTNDN_23080 [Niallia sp. HCP3S3_B10]|uniref:hypothetical protein n=1 Tax=Niallia sp. HCP3S3_B10 TaxID=3438944 RepID=UPI003F8A1BDE